MIKTKWKIEADEITLYPNLMASVFGLIFLAIFIAFGIYAKNTFLSSTISMTSYMIIVSLLTAMFLLLARNKVVFDRVNKQMYLKLFGVLTIKTVDFSNIAAIQAVHQNGAGFNFQVFQRDNRHGKGIGISAGYSKETNKNAIALTNEVFPLIDSFLAEVPFNDVVPSVEPISDYLYFKVDQGIYTLKSDGSLVLVLGGFGIIAWGIFAYFGITPSLSNDPIFLVYLPVLFGLFLLFASTKKISFDTYSKVIRTSFIGGLKSKEYAFSSFRGFDIVRKTTNFVYSGTDVNIKLEDSKNNKIYGVLLQSFRSPKKIEQFIRETESIIGFSY